MAYPYYTQEFTIKIDKNASGYAIGPEYFNVPSASPYEIYLDHVPYTSATTTVGASGGAAWTEVLVAPTAVGTYLVDYTTGKLKFYSGNASAAVQASYKCLGDDIMAEHVNMLQQEVESIENELGPLPKGSQNSVIERLNTMQADINSKGLPLASGINGAWITDNTIRAGALESDIKGVNWVTDGRPVLTDIVDHENKPAAAHAASAISVTPPGTATFTSVQGHINARGAATITDNNPHGMTIAGMSSNIDVPGNIVSGGDISGNSISASGQAIYINSLGPDRDSYLYYWNNSNQIDRFLRWNNTADVFELNDDLVLIGGITASGNMMPEASGTRSVGSQALPFSAGNFGTVRGDTGYFTNIYGAGTGLMHNTLGHLLWSQAGHTMDANISPTASGAQSAGTIALPWGSGNFNVVQAASYMTGASSGATGQFTSSDGKTVKVKNGLIVSIV